MTGRSVRVRVEDLVKEYPESGRVLDRVTFSVEPGERVVLLGENGSGKSTLLRTLVRLEEPTAGRVELDGVGIATADAKTVRAMRRRVGFISQSIDLVANASAFSNVVKGALGRGGVRRWWAATAPEEDRRHALQCLERVELAEKARQRVERLSGGQQQRVALARALMQRPDVMLADEPVASLDPRASTAMLDLLWSVGTERRLTILCALHQVDLAVRYADRIIGLERGRVVLDERAGDVSADDLRALYRQERRRPAVGAVLP